MELKLAELRAMGFDAELLIVPYGIETQETVTRDRLGGELLIVPYGIETCNVRRTYRKDNLLIVPYGIETWNLTYILRGGPYF